MSICDCGRLSVCLLVIVPVPLSRLSLVRFFSSVCGRVLRFVRGCVVVSVAVSSRILYRMM